MFSIFVFTYLVLSGLQEISDFKLSFIFLLSGFFQSLCNIHIPGNSFLCISPINIISYKICLDKYLIRDIMLDISYEIYYFLKRSNYK